MTTTTVAPVTNLTVNLQAPDAPPKLTGLLTYTVGRNSNNQPLIRFDHADTPLTINGVGYWFRGTFALGGRFPNQHPTQWGRVTGDLKRDHNGQPDYHKTASKAANDKLTRWLTVVAGRLAEAHQLALDDVTESFNFNTWATTADRLELTGRFLRALDQVTAMITANPARYRSRPVEPRDELDRDVHWPVPSVFDYDLAPLKTSNRRVTTVIADRHNDDIPVAIVIPTNKPTMTLVPIELVTFHPQTDEKIASRLDDFEADQAHQADQA